MPDQQTSRPGFGTVLRQPQFRRLWTARTVSQWGDVFSFVALAILIYRLTGSGLGVAGVVVAEIILVLVIAPVAGVVVDRLPRIQVMVASDLFRALLAVVLAIWHDEAAVVYAVAFGLSAGAVFFNPAANSVLPSIVKREEIVAANSATWTAAVVSQVVSHRCPAGSWQSSARDGRSASTLRASFCQRSCCAACG